MDAKTREALEASIKHWEDIRDADSPVKVILGPDECALCCSFHHRGECAGCPVKARTGMGWCRGTPFVSAEYALRRWAFSKASETARNAWRAAAQAELDFLISLRPEVEA